LLTWASATILAGFSAEKLGLQAGDERVAQLAGPRALRVLRQQAVA